MLSCSPLTTLGAAAAARLNTTAEANMRRPAVEAILVSYAECKQQKQWHKRQAKRGKFKYETLLDPR
jgi:hypothetical protein